MTWSTPWTSPGTSWLRTPSPETPRGRESWILSRPRPARDPPRHRTPRRTYTATRVSHPNCSRFTCPAAGLPSPLTHLWRPPAIAGAGGHTQVDSGTPYRGRGQPRGAAGQAPSSPDQAERPPGLPTTPQPRWHRHRPWWGRPAPRPPPTTTRKRRPPTRRPGHSPPTDNPPGHPPMLVTRLWSPPPPAHSAKPCATPSSPPCPDTPTHPGKSPPPQPPPTPPTDIRRPRDPHHNDRRGSRGRRGSHVW